jgi:hypothetical protein
VPRYYGFDAAAVKALAIAIDRCGAGKRFENARGAHFMYDLPATSGKLEYVNRFCFHWVFSQF